MKKVVVVGGGASGMMAAIIAAKNGKEVLLIEKNDRLGKKIFISGKGRCNVTTSKPIEEIIKNIPGNGKFMYRALNTFSNVDLINFIEKKGIKLKIERGDRVFPESDKSSDIIKCFEKYIDDYNVKVILNSKVTDIFVKDNHIAGIELNGKDIIKCDSVILATGGVSYPGTGSNGEGHKLAQKLGHKITDLKPSLVPLVTKEEWVKDLMGLSLKNVEIKIYNKNKAIYQEFGEMLFTHFGISGPIVLSASRSVVDLLPNEVEVFIDIKPALTFEELDRRILRDFEMFKNKDFKNSLEELLPKKMIPIVIKLSNINPNKKVNSITKAERLGLVKLIKEFKVTVIGTRPIAEAIITRGGVSVKEVDPQTMESKLIKGLFIAGELLDVDAYTGGFNLQIAFSTGYCAGLYS
ncbi:Fumarate reductase flavoprotein subunit precursor [Caloramator mitchellensis]|uniref:Fumarate reductase flavoprotein subunit n=1 Tax=Caloramator mitchellensis TaxID=908809 RepID=A0A0R3K175_CALMK|nr:NAD(P)/FAD-dependent oxidoreductase [Caloramator mitchellensis]KRQ86626.1 Fumarate reductase flavoprotein subunit precursor [Caloramator mitchellensis]